MTEKKLSKACLNLWLAVHWWIIGIIALAGTIPWITTLLIDKSPMYSLLVIPVAVLAIGVIIHYYIKGYWKRFMFAFDQDQIRIDSGIWWRKQVLIPFSRITNIDIMQGPWQRKRLLATLKIQTAGLGATSTAEAQLFSQEGSDALREELLSRVLKSKSRLPGDGTDDATNASDMGSGWERIIEILKRIEENTRSVENEQDK